MATTPSQNWRPLLNRRIGIAAVGLALWSIAIEARLVHLQVVQHADLSSRAERQQNRTVTAFAKRGEIHDRNGNLLAFSVEADTIYAVPGEIGSPVKVAGSLCATFKDCSASERRTLVERLSSRRAFVYVRRQVSPDEAQAVADLQLEGIGFMKESRRYYPKRQLASHVLGYVGIDNIGLAGLESTYDKLIKGEPGKVLIRTDAKRRPFSSVEKPPTPGATLELTIDQQLQYIVERELEAGVRENGAEGGAVVMMDPWSGEILAMANYPAFNPNDPRSSREEERRNRAIQDIYEPGSTFKIVTASAALEQRVVTPDQLIDASGGRIRFGSRVVRDTHDYGVLSFTDVIVKSSNVGAIRVGLRLGPQRLSDYVRRFGFGQHSSPDFPAESSGIVWDSSKLTESALASVSMGYQISVTPLQMAAAVSSVANGGDLVQPRVVRAVIRDNVRTAVPRKVLGRTIENKEVIAQLTTIMEKVVEDGTAKAARIDGFTIAGKTGTAAQLVNGRYSATLWNASFVGFVPSRKPEFTLIVVIDAPHTKGHTGGVAAAPVFKRIAEAALRQTAVPRSINPPPPILAGNRRPRLDPIIAAPVVMSSVKAGAPALIPDLRGKSAREALLTLAALGLDVRLRGSGWVVNQDPAPGTLVDDAATTILWLDREPSRTTSVNTGETQ
ncbi:MAG: penicillin-binding transpeptidase domain-containing protein [Vicinamibacterales bacterium]